MGSGTLKKLSEEVNYLDVEAETRSLSEAKINFWREAQNIIRELDYATKLDVKQKAKVKWICNGDENTRLFHGMLRNKNTKNRIHGIRING